MKKPTEVINLKKIGYDEIFKTMMKNYFSPFANVITDYEILDLPKKADLLIIEVKKSIKRHVKVFTHFKKYNIIEFKSETDTFRMNRDLFKIGIYRGGVLLKEKDTNLENTTFSLVSSRKPVKLLKTYNNNVQKLKKGVYLLQNIGLISVYVVAIEELEINLDKEITILKEFSTEKDRKDFFVEIIDKYNKDNTKYNEIIKYAALMHENEIYEIIKNRGSHMNTMLKDFKIL